MDEQPLVWQHARRGAFEPAPRTTGHRPHLDDERIRIATTVTFRFQASCTPNSFSIHANPNLKDLTSNERCTISIIFRLSQTHKPYTNVPNMAKTYTNSTRSSQTCFLAVSNRSLAFNNKCWCHHTNVQLNTNIQRYIRRHGVSMITSQWSRPIHYIHIVI